MKEKEVLFLKKRLMELAAAAFYKNIATHSVFLNLHEQTIFCSMVKELPNIPHTLFGGHPLAERKVVFFLKEEESVFSYIRISPKNPRFAETLTHRDFLGALMHLGLERHTMGDIMVEENQAHLVVLSSVARVVLGLEQVRLTKVAASLETQEDFSPLAHLREETIHVSSLRLDGILASVFHLSRSGANVQIDGGKVFVNGRQIFSHSMEIAPGDIVSLRGFGRFRFKGEVSTSKKGRLFAKVESFI